MNETYSLTVERLIPGPIEQVFDAWLDPVSMKQWMRPGAMALSAATTNPVVGGTYALTFTGEGQVIPHEGEYREIRRPHRIVFTWKSEHAGDTLVTLDFTKVSERKTKVTLTHERFAAVSARDSHRSGWGTILEKLEKAMGGTVMTKMSRPFIDELTREAETTRRVLERVPQEKLAWKPHPKSMSLGQLALHVAQTPGQVAQLITETECEVPQFTQPEAKSRAELLTALEQSISGAKAKLEGWDDEGMMVEWKLRRGPKTIMALPRAGMVRSIMLNHWYHHRGQLLVYLRLLDVPVPSVYGPSADENPFA